MPAPLYYRHPEFLGEGTDGLSWPRLEAIAHLFRLWAFCFESEIYLPHAWPGGEHDYDRDRAEVLRGTPFWNFF